MNSTYPLFFLCLFLMYSCSTKKQIQEGVHTHGGFIQIDLHPRKDNKILMSSIVKKISVIPLETTSESLIARIDKIEYDEDEIFILNSFDKLVYAFNREGRFSCRIGEKGNGPGEVLNPGGFALNRKNKEVWLNNNYRFFEKYDYTGLHEDRQEIKLFFGDFTIADDGYLYFYVAKRFNFSASVDEASLYELWALNPDQQFTVFFPFDGKVFPNGGSEPYMSNLTPFNRVGTEITYNHLLSDTVYTFYKNQLKPRYVINFGDKKMDLDFSTVRSKDLREYMLAHPEKAGVPNGFCETSGMLCFRYSYNLQGNQVLYNKANGSMIDGLWEDDILGTHFSSRYAYDGKIINYVHPSEITLKDRATQFFTEAEIKELKKRIDDTNSNPVLIEYEFAGF